MGLCEEQCSYGEGRDCANLATDILRKRIALSLVVLEMSTLTQTVLLQVETVLLRTETV